MEINNSSKLSVIDVILSLRLRLLDAIEKGDLDTMRIIAAVFDMLWDLAEEKGIQGGLYRMLEDLANAARDHAAGIGWKGIVPSDEQVRTALQDETN